MAVVKAPRYLRFLSSSATQGSGAIHIRITPRPRNLGESREVLRVLEKYGEVVMFKHLKYEPQAPAPNVILAIYKSPASAQRLIGSSPLQLKLQLVDTGWEYDVTESAQQTHDHADEGSEGLQEKEVDVTEDRMDGSPARQASIHAATATIDKNDKFQGLGGSQKWGSWSPSAGEKSPAPEKPQPGSASSAMDSVALPPNTPAARFLASKGISSRSIAPQYRDTELKITPSSTNHQAYIERQGYYGPFIANKKSIMAQDLEGRVPLDGLLDCQLSKTEVPLRTRIKRTEKGTLAPFSLKALYEEKHG